MNPQTIPDSLRRTSIWIPALCGFLLGAFCLWQIQSRTVSRPPVVAKSGGVPNDAVKAEPGGGQTINIYAHNLRLAQGPKFRVYIQWLRGQLKPSQVNKIPSFDDPESFYLNVTNGVMRVNIGDICDYLNSQSGKTPLTDIKLTGTGDQVKIMGNYHKGVTLPVEVIGTIKPAYSNRLEVQVSKINVLKIPFKAILGGLHIKLADLLPSEPIRGVQLEGDKIYFDSNQLLPPPYIRGTLTKVSLGNPDLEAVYGDVTKDVAKVEEWRNFLRLTGGTLNFGKLTMRNVDLMMVDISQDAWFDLDLARYQDQLVNGYSRMTPNQGLQIFMPDVSELKTNHISQISIEWFKDRKASPPPSVVPHKP